MPKPAGFVERRTKRRPFSIRIQHLLVLLSIGLLTLGLGLTGVSTWTSLEFEKAAARSEAMMDSMRNHMTADMLHDGLRGVVYRQMYGAMTFNNDTLKQGIDELAEYGGAFRAAIAAQGELAIPDSVRTALDGVSGPLDAYIDSAGTLVNMAVEGKLPEARDQLPSFDTTFKALESAMAAVSDAIELANQESNEQASIAARNATIANWSSVALTLVLVTAMLILGRRYVSGPLMRLTTIMRKLANGDADFTLDGIQRIREIDGMQGVVSTYQNALNDRDHLASETERTTAAMRQRSDEAAALNREFGRVVAAAVNGDFTQRVEGSYSDDSLTALTEGFNKLVEGVDRAIAETGAALSALAEADLTHRVTGNYSGALARLKDDTNSVADKFTSIVEQLRGTSSQLKTATEEILSGANDLSDRTGKQAARIAETSSNIDQLASTVRRNAERAVEASRNAQDVRKAASEGGAVMAAANAAMERITASSSKISNIIGLIDDVAFQTNLLALNASVEAARAGESGKGFAVVAIEVRRLAQSAAEASAQVKQLIEQSAGEVATGSQLVSKAASAIEAMLHSIQRNNDLMDNIARESSQQAESIADVNLAVREMEEMTQQNAALVEETNAAIEQTESQARELDDIVDVFTLRRTAPQQRMAS